MKALGDICANLWEDRRAGQRPLRRVQLAGLHGQYAIADRWRPVAQSRIAAEASAEHGLHILLIMQLQQQQWERVDSGTGSMSSAKW